MTLVQVTGRLCDGRELADCVKPYFPSIVSSNAILCASTGRLNFRVLGYLLARSPVLHPLPDFLQREPEKLGYVPGGFGDAFLLQRIVERDEALAVEGIGSEEQEDAQVFVGVGAGDGEVLGIHASILLLGSDIRGPTTKNKFAPRASAPRRPPPPI